MIPHTASIVHTRRILLAVLRQHLENRKRIAMANSILTHFPPQVIKLLSQNGTESLELSQKILKTKDFWLIDTKNETGSLLYETASGLIWDGSPDCSIQVETQDQNLTKNYKNQTFSSGFFQPTDRSTGIGLKEVEVFSFIGALLKKTLTSDRNTHSLNDAEKIIAARQKQYAWRLPTPEELLSFAKNKNNPLRSGEKNRLLNADYWLTDQGRVDLDSNIANPIPQPGRLIACIDTASTADFIQLALDNQWKVYAGNDKSKTDLLAPVKQLSLQAVFKDIDFRPCRLPRLEPAIFTDPNKGLWELWGSTPEALAEHNIRARNPADDVKDSNIAIDFGTSSTVVAYDNNGQYELLRIGVKDFFEAPKPEHYENPTVLEFIDFQKMLSSWQADAYRPNLNWDDILCSHEALHNLRNNETNPIVVASILGKIKQWALRQGMDRTLRIIDQRQQFEHEFKPLAARMPVRGKMLEVGANDPFDPVELYAWFLGMHINWRGRGLFLRYYMTFPIAYPREVKENILSAFRRGLQRSLPATLVEHPVFSTFAVEELASEPAAYAAAALPQLGLSPTAKGLAYAVFDFGGGTADFDFGYYRQPTPEEEDNGCEVVFEHFGNEGDRFLGGENLLENMAYLTFLHNLEICRKSRIAFNKPLDAKDFAGSELFLEDTQAATTNTLMLVARLRPLWETGALRNSSGIEKIDLINRDGQKINCELAVPIDTLLQYLEQRIETGIQNFFVAMKNAFADKLPSEIHVLLAGNSSRSQLVSNFFGLTLAQKDQEEVVEHPLFVRTRTYLGKLFSEVSPGITVHPPLPMDAQNLYRPTGKTGVALGLLRLCPGGVVDVINHSRITSGDQAPFAHYVGRVRQGSFQPALRPGMAYNEWHEVGPPRDRVFNLFHTQTPKANTGEMKEGESGLFKKRLDLAGDTAGKRIFVRAVMPNSIEYCTAGSSDEIKQGHARENFVRIELT